MAGARFYEAIIGPHDIPLKPVSHKLTVSERKARREKNALKARKRSKARKGGR